MDPTNGCCRIRSNDSSRCCLNVLNRLKSCIERLTLSNQSRSVIRLSKSRGNRIKRNRIISKGMGHYVSRNHLLHQDH